MNNNVQFERSYNYTVTDGKPDTTNPWLTKVIEYNRKGLVIKSENYSVDPYQYANSQNAFYYDENNHIVTSDQMDQLGNVIYHTEYIYENGLNIRYIVTDHAGTEINSADFKYNKNGKYTEKNSIDIDTSMNYLIKAYYNSEGKETLCQTFNHKKILSFEVKTLVDKHDYMEQKIIDHINQQTFHLKTNFNRNKQIIRSKTISDPIKNKGFWTEWAYDNNNLLIEVKTFDLTSGKLIELERIKYSRF